MIYSGRMGENMPWLDVEMFQHRCDHFYRVSIEFRAFGYGQGSLDEHILQLVGIRSFRKTRSVAPTPGRSTVTIRTPYLFASGSEGQRSSNRPFRDT